MDLHQLQPFALAFLVGLLVGIERERSHPEAGSAMGLRTFLLLALLGALAGATGSDWIAASAAVFAFLLVTASYIATTRRRRPDFGLTTEVAAGVVFFLGYLSHRNPVTVSLLAPLVALILFSKQALHRFTQKIKAAELNAALIILLGGVAVVNLLENRVVDPWGLFNPKKFGLLILVLAALEFSSYLAVKLLGGKVGALATGFLGGIVSSTAVTLSSARKASEDPADWRLQLVSTLSAQMASLAEVFFLVVVISRPLAWTIALPLGTSFLLGSLALWFFSRKAGADGSSLELRSPLHIKGVLRLGILLALVLAAIATAQKWLGEKGTQLASFLTGLFELHGVTIATATLHSENHLPLQGAQASLVAAILASFVSKIILGWVVGKGAYARALCLLFAGLGGLFFLAAWLLA